MAVIREIADWAKHICWFILSCIGLGVALKAAYLSFLFGWRLF
jgi:hypothetical protein